MNKKVSLSFIVGILVGLSVYHTIHLRRAPPASPNVQPQDVRREEVAESKCEPVEVAPQQCPACPVCDDTTRPSELLPPPSFSESTPKSLETNMEGEVRLTWTSVEGAKKYRVRIKNPTNGKHVKSYSTNKTTLYLKEIPRPKNLERIEYVVTLSTINLDEIEGQPGEERQLVVKGKPELTAPSIKMIKVED